MSGGQCVDARVITGYVCENDRQIYSHSTRRKVGMEAEIFGIYDQRGSKAVSSVTIDNWRSVTRYLYDRQETRFRQGNLDDSIGCSDRYQWEYANQYARETRTRLQSSLR